MNTLSKCAIFFLCAALFAGCKKEDSKPERFTNLIGKWRLIARGQDTNNNGVLDSTERTPVTASPMIEDEYLSTGKGIHTVTFGSDPYADDFDWTLLNGDKTLRIVENKGKLNEATNDYPILSLTKQELIYFASPTGDYVIYTKL